MKESPAAIFQRLSRPQQPGYTLIYPGRVFVLGGSIAGLLAARVLADHADNVVIVERDGCGAERQGTARPGVPHGLQLHALLPAGRAQLERWFPGLTQEAQDRGAVMSGPDGTAAYADDIRQVRTENSVLLTCSRPFLESLIRRRTLALPNVELITGNATGLVYAGDTVTGVRYAAADAEIEDSAELVVDAMGRASRLSDWLEHDGWERPRLERMQTNINYATAFFKRADDRPVIGAAIARYSPRYPDKNLGAASAIEGRQWMVMLAGYGDNRPGRTQQDFLARTAKLPPIFSEASAGELIGEIRTYHQADSRRRRFTGLKRLPARLVSVGDAVASFNPIYGQGISSAALHASCLSEYLGTNPDRNIPAWAFFALQEVVVDAAWETSTTADAARLAPAGKPSAKARFLRWAGEQVLAAAVTDEKIATSFNEVTGMTAHPATLTTPGTLLRAIVVNRRAGNTH